VTGAVAAMATNAPRGSTPVDRPTGAATMMVVVFVDTSFSRTRACSPFLVVGVWLALPAHEIPIDLCRGHGSHSTVESRDDSLHWHLDSEHRQMPPPRKHRIDLLTHNGLCLDPSLVSPRKINRPTFRRRREPPSLPIMAWPRVARYA
jgi:hypothetical protein